MAYQFKDLSVLAYANGFTLWHYTTPDTDIDVMADGAFDLAADMLRAGDIIIATVDNSRIPDSLLMLVKSVAGGVVAMGRMGGAAPALAAAA
jgi:hypothetical protein